MHVCMYVCIYNIVFKVSNSQLFHLKITMCICSIANLIVVAHYPN